MKPKKVNILGKEYSIQYCDNPADVDMNKRKSLWGQIDYWKREIRIYDNGRSMADIWETIVHEILHAINSDLHLECFDINYTDKDKKHDELDIVAMALVDTFIRNNWLKVE